MPQTRRHPLIILAKGLGTRMAISKPKTLIELSSGQTILARLLQEACLAETVSEIVLFVRNDSRELREVISQVPLPVEVIVEEPEGYFRDLVAAKKRIGIEEFSVIDSDLVAPNGEITHFLLQAPQKPAWLTIGVTAIPEELSGRPTWVDTDSAGRIQKMSRTRRLPYRTVGIFHWSGSALTMKSRNVTTEASIMAYVIEHLEGGYDIEGVRFSRTVNVNTKDDVAAANRLIASE